MSPSDAKIRKYFMKYYSNDELEVFCFDYFNAVRENFSPRMSKSDKVMRLVRYCRRHQQIPALMQAVRVQRPQQYQQYFGDSDQAIAAEDDEAERPLASTPLASAIQVVQSDIETIQVRILIRSTGARHIIEIPYDGSVNDVIPLLVEQLGLPAYFDDGSEVSRELYSESRKTYLRGDRTFRQNDVQDGEILSFYYAGGDE